MKNTIVKSITTLAFLFITVLGFSHTSDLPTSQIFLPTLESSFNQTLSPNSNYCWTAIANAVNYRIELMPSSVNGITLYSTTNSVDLSRIVSGNYEVVVIAEYASGSESIIIEDAIVI